MVVLRRKLRKHKLVFLFSQAQFVNFNPAKTIFILLWMGQFCQPIFCYFFIALQESSLQSIQGGMFWRWFFVTVSICASLKSFLHWCIIFFTIWIVELCETKFQFVVLNFKLLCYVWLSIDWLSIIIEYGKIKKNYSIIFRKHFITP